MMACAVLFLALFTTWTLDPVALLRVPLLVLVAASVLLAIGFDIAGALRERP